MSESLTLPTELTIAASRPVWYVLALLAAAYGLVGFDGGLPALAAIVPALAAGFLVGIRRVHTLPVALVVGVCSYLFLARIPIELAIQVGRGEMFVVAIMAALTPKLGGVRLRLNQRGFESMVFWNVETSAEWAQVEKVEARPGLFGGWTLNVELSGRPDGRRQCIRIDHSMLEFKAERIAVLMNRFRDRALSDALSE